MDNQKTGNTSSHTKSPQQGKTSIIVSWVLVAVWAAVIFFMSANTGSNLSDDLGFFSGIYQQMKDVQEGIFGPGVDVLSPIAHFCEYLLFGALLTNALRHKLSLRHAVLTAIVIASAYGVTDEFHQYFVPERMCDPLDWLVDTIGASVGAGLAYLIFSRKRSAS